MYYAQMGTESSDLALCRVATGRRHSATLYMYMHMTVQNVDLKPSLGEIIAMPAQAHLSELYKGHGEPFVYAILLFTCI